MAGETDPHQQAALEPTQATAETDEGGGAPVAEPPPKGAPQTDFTPRTVLLRALEKGVEVAAERSAQPLTMVLLRALAELRHGEMSAGTERTLRAALSAAHHNPSLSATTRTALATVSVALRGMK